ncbi:MAG: hypothetical protein JXR96_20460 [Deltaproteobacteria bacterium]|nr:hypothetical protein [Deltaproteobacteria bacterium]
MAETKARGAKKSNRSNAKRRSSTTPNQRKLPSKATLRQLAKDWEHVT